MQEGELDFLSIKLGVYQSGLRKVFLLLLLLSVIKLEAPGLKADRGLPGRAQIENTVLTGTRTLVAIRRKDQRAIVRKDLILDLKEREIWVFNARGAGASTSPSPMADIFRYL